MPPDVVHTGRTTRGAGCTGRPIASHSAEVAMQDHPHARAGSRPARLIIVAAATLAAFACDHNPTSAPLVAASLSLVQGAQQTAQVGMTLGTPVGFLVKDS